MSIPVIDIFAGPGGLGEGFSSVVKKGKRAFDIRLSIEKDENAHKTLKLRSFYRSFPIGKVPDKYYEVLQQTSVADRDRKIEELFEEYPKNALKAETEAWCATLGGENFPSEIVDERIQYALNGEKNWVLIGGPPCQAYSLVGRSRNQWKDNVDGKDPRVHLYKEYLRIIAEHKPAVFVMENVRGMLSAKLEGKKMFNMILEDLQNPDRAFPGLEAPGYTVYSLTTPFSERDLHTGQPLYHDDADFLVRCEDYGVPQRRHRVILLGVREDIGAKPEALTKAKEQVTVEEVIRDLPALRSGLGRTFSVVKNPDGTKQRKYKTVPDTTENWNKIVNDFRQEVVSWNGFDKKFSKSIEEPPTDTGSEFIPCQTPQDRNPLAAWYRDPKLRGVCNHQTRSHLLLDLKRYLFSAVFTKTYGRFPRLHEIEEHSPDLMPDHENARSGKFADRFRVQLADQPATTITSHISKDGHYFIHYDPDQCRSLTVREAARIQTFPDNYLFCGSRTAQYHQVGNAVPPYVAKQIGEVVLNVVKGIMRIRMKERESMLQF